jgi:hypothetical protein
MNEYPKQVKIGGQTINVKEVNYSDNSETDMGNAYMGEGLLTISKNYKSGGVPVAQCHDSKVNTFYHELTHLILIVMGRFDLNDDEVFVSCFGSFLCEAMRSAGAKFPDMDGVKKLKEPIDTQIINE